MTEHRVITTGSGSQTDARLGRTYRRHLSNLAVGIVAVSFALSGCASTSNPLPAGSDKFPTAEATVAEVPVAEVPADAAPAATSCDVVMEAFLTGTPAQITASLNVLIKDKKMDATAREYAQNYTVRDKGNKDLQSMDASLIKMSCS